LRIVLVALAVGAWLVVGASSASAATVTCGQTITQDTTVENDLSDCPGDGLVVGADNITLDLNGHSISGTVSAHRTAGVRVLDRSGVTVRNGTIANFGSSPNVTDAAVAVQGGAANRVLLLTLSGPGIHVGGGHGNTIAFNNVPTDIDLEGSSGNEVAFNVGGADIQVNFGAHDNRIERNRAQAIGGLHSDHNYVGYNTVTGGNIGTGFGAFDWFIEHNTLLGSTIELDDSSGVVIFRNFVLGSPHDGIRLVEQAHEGRTANNVLLGNTVARSAANGIFIQGPTGPGPESQGAVNTLIRHNKTRRNGNDGIHTNAPTTTLTKNIANFNTNVGINATAGAIDGGRNHAHGNGLAQCINIACSP
jgi:large repetitive protein